MMATDTLKIRVIARTMIRPYTRALPRFAVMALIRIATAVTRFALKISIMMATDTLKIRVIARIMIRPYTRGAPEICGDGIDQDCNGSDLICPEDIDNDGDGYTENQGDCNDNDATIYPGAVEICGDGIDQDCSGMDLECLPDPNEVDDDGDGFTENEGDCNDSDTTIFPGAIEICGDGIDQDCDGSDLECIREDIPGFVMETGEAEVNHDWQFVPFTKAYVDPVVVAKPMSLNGGQPGVIRISNVTSIGFEIRVPGMGIS